MKAADWDVPWQRAMSVGESQRAAVTPHLVSLGGRKVYVWHDERHGWRALDARCEHCGGEMQLSPHRGEIATAACERCDRQWALDARSLSWCPCMVVDEDLYVLDVIEKEKSSI